jgi:ribosomal protein S18 acetylase RimI-like enzyme
MIDKIKVPNLLRIDESLVIPASFSCQRAFQDDPITAYLIPGLSNRDKQHYAFELGLRLTLAGTGEAYTTSANCEGVALWSPAEDKQSMGLILGMGWPPLALRCGWRHVWRDMKVNNFLTGLRHRYAPSRHIYLSLLAVDPAFQGRGCAGALLRPMLVRLDNEKTACYLETQNRGNVAMYQHFGFKLVTESVIPGTDLIMYSMLRETS